MLNLNKSLLVALAVLPLLASGCAARYRTIHKEAPAENTEPSGSDATPETKSPGPSANVEVIVGGSAVTQVKASDSFTIRPTATTVDPDNAVMANCPNPGILKADFTVSDGASLSSSRTAAQCDQLQVPYTIATPGKYTIKMTVTTDDGEKADASMTLIVTADTPTGPGGFVITATPIVTYTGDTVTFHGACENGAIGWNYADGASGQGADTTHAYAGKGSYVVIAQCVRPSASSSTEAPLEATVTIVVLDKPGTTPETPDGGTTGGGTGGTTGGTTGDASSISDGGTGGGTTGGGDDDPEDPSTPNDPGQTPGQSPGQTPYQGRIK